MHYCLSCRGLPLCLWAASAVRFQSGSEFKKLTCPNTTGHVMGVNCPSETQFLFFDVCMLKTEIVHLNEEKNISVTCPYPCSENCVAIFTPLNEKLSKKGVLCASSISEVSENETGIPIRVINMSDKPITLFKDMKIGCIEIMDSGTDIETIQFLEENCDSAKFDVTEKVGIGKSLSRSEFEQLTALLREYPDIFSTHKMDLGLCDIVKHEIALQHNTPIRQNMRRVPLGLEDDVDKLVDDLLTKK